MTRKEAPPLAQVLRTLADHLTDAALAECFPGTPPAGIRRRLLDAAGGAGPAEPASPPVPPAPEKPGRVTLFTDGASRGNPGEAGAGFVLLDQAGRELLARGIYLGQCTNNMAEYRALLLGLAAAEELGAEEIAVKLDSELIVRQINGVYRVKNQHLKPLYAEAMAMLKRYKAFSVSHVPRNENSRADQLANQGIDKKAPA